MEYWEHGMEALEQHQEFLQHWHHELAKRLSMEGFPPVESGFVPQPMAMLRDLLGRQFEFNNQVIQMLVDLDTRKSENA